MESQHSALRRWLDNLIIIREYDWIYWDDSLDVWHPPAPLKGDMIYPKNTRIIYIYMGLTIKGITIQGWYWLTFRFPVSEAEKVSEGVPGDVHAHFPFIVWRCVHQHLLRNHRIISSLREAWAEWIRHVPSILFVSSCSKKTWNINHHGNPQPSFYLHVSWFWRPRALS